MTAQKLISKLNPWDVEFYARMAEIDLAKGWLCEPYTGRALTAADHTIFFVVNKDGMVLPTTRRDIAPDEPNQIASAHTDIFYPFGPIQVDRLVEKGVKTAPDILEYARQLTAIVQSDKENYLSDWGLERIVQNNALPALN